MAYNFYIQTVTRTSSGDFILGTEYDIETQWKGAKYKQIIGLKNYGKPRPYVETYAESDMALVSLPQTDSVVNSDPRDATSVNLTLYFFCENTSANTDAKQIKAIDDIYHSFVSTISGKYIIYHDTARQRYAFLYLSDKIEPKTDSIKGVKYVEAEFKFTNVFGRTFSTKKELTDAIGITS